MQCIINNNEYEDNLRQLFQRDVPDGAAEEAY
jgi:hypothetical protein